MTGKENNYGTDHAYFLTRNSIGNNYKGTKEEEKITQIFADSTSTECQQYLNKLLKGNKIDFAFIDGAHDYESVKHDFEKLILPKLAEDGVVIFDDYSNLSTQPGVASFLTEKARKDNFLFYWFAPYPNPNKKIHHVSYLLIANK